MSARALLVAALLFVSGCCALVYQVAWLREFRLVFGGSTTATAAVLAVFMGGLGFGNLLLGRYADRHPSPLRLYAQLELAITACAAISPWLVDLVRVAYGALGGQAALGVTGATLARLLGTMLVLAAPTLLMGGTLPAAAKLVTGADDKQRRGLGLVYGFNTIGAVLGTLASTFVLLPSLGTRSTLWLACALNLCLAMVAWKWSQTPHLLIDVGESRRERKRHKKLQSDEAVDPVAIATVAPTWCYTTAFLLGALFFLMEIVWYRMLAPLLGGTTYTFGIILAVALTGIGIGGALYPLLFRRRSPTALHFAIACALQAFVTAVPFALGDRFALWSVVQLEKGADDFNHLVIAWGTIALAMVLPPSLFSGLQFPMLLGLAGRGDEQVARQVGIAFACNTVGCIIGSLLGGFGLLPLLTAPGVWMLVIGMLAILSIAWAAPTIVGVNRLKGLAPLAISAMALAMLFATGPTAVWRHSSIGAGRSAFNRLTAQQRAEALRQGRSGYEPLLPSEWQLRKNQLLRFVRWERDGVESSLAIRGLDSFALYVNGKSDGDARGDAPTQIMLGMIPAALHANPKTAFVVGLGTGETAGWLGAIPHIERVDCVELEPEVREMARRCSTVNHNVLANPKVHIETNDARESLIASHAKYDLIISEPSNPYRAGVANLFTREFYRAARQRLNDGGIFGQWLQAYEVDAQTVGTVLNTLRQEFGHVELWQLKQNDLLLVAADKPININSSRLKETLDEPIFREALRIAWRAKGAEGLFSSYVGGPMLIEHLAADASGSINTDDHNLLEYAFARTVGNDAADVDVVELREVAAKLRDHRPAIDGAIDWQRVTDYYLLDCVADGTNLPFIADLNKEQTARWLAWNAYLHRNYADTIQHWARQPRRAESATELAVLAVSYLHQDDPRAGEAIAALHDIEPIDADSLAAMYAFRDGDYPLAAKYLERAIIALRTDPWPGVVQSPCPLAIVIAQRDPKLAGPLLTALQQPFAVDFRESERLDAALELARIVGGEALLKQIEAYEPHVPWTASFLKLRAETYAAAQHPRAALAKKQQEQFEAQAR